MKSIKLFFAIVFLGSFLFFPLTSLAGSYDAIDEGGISHTVEYQGLVPCGKNVCFNGEYNENGVCAGEEKEFPCQFCHFLVMLNGIINFVLFKLIPPIAVLMLVIGGAMFIIARFAEPETLVPGGGDPKLLSQGKRIMTSVFISLIIIFSGWIFINWFFSLIGLSDFSIQAGLGPGEWNKIECSVKFLE